MTDDTQPVVETPPVDFGSLGVLFDRDPLSLTNQDLETIISGLRSARNQWAIDEQNAANKGKKPRGGATEKKASATAGLKEVTLSDLGL